MKYDYEDVEVGIGDYIYHVSGSYEDYREVDADLRPEPDLAVDSLLKYEDGDEPTVLDPASIASWLDAYRAKVEEAVLDRLEDPDA